MAPPPETVTENAVVDACKRSDIAQLKLWAQCGVRIVSYVPFVIAVQSEELDVMRCLAKDFGVDVNQRMPNGQTFLYKSALEGRLGVVECLVEELGADVNQPCGANRYRRPLCIPASSGQLGFVRCLLKAGAHINYANGTGDTALMGVARFKHKALTKWLVKAGADPQVSYPLHVTAADNSRAVGASSEQTEYLEAMAHCAHPVCDGAGTKKCQG